MIFTRPLFAARNKRFKFGDKTLPHLDKLPRDNFFGMSKRRLCWTVIIVTVPLVAVFSRIVYRRLVLDEERRKTFREGGIDGAYLVDNLAGLPKLPRKSSDKSNLDE